VDDNHSFYQILEFSWKPGDPDPIRAWLANNQVALDHRKNRKERPDRRVRLKKKIQQCQEDLKKMVEPTDEKIKHAVTASKRIAGDINSLKQEMKQSGDDSGELGRRLAELKREKKALPKALTVKAKR
jgi:chromosome segregation ATPase